jgi:hypothetical protein
VSLTEVPQGIAYAGIAGNKFDLIFAHLLFYVVQVCRRNMVCIRHLWAVLRTPYLEMSKESIWDLQVFWL